MAGRRIQNVLMYFGLANGADDTEPEPWVWSAGNILLLLLQSVIVTLLMWALNGGTLARACGFGLTFVVLMTALIEYRRRRGLH